MLAPVIGNALISYKCYFKAEDICVNHICFAYCSHHGFPVWPESSGWHDVHWNSTGLLTGCCVCTDTQVGTFIENNYYITCLCSFAKHCSLTAFPKPTGMITQCVKCTLNLMLLHHTGDVRAVNTLIVCMRSYLLFKSHQGDSSPQPQ